MISSSIGSSHPAKYSFENPTEYLSGWRNLSVIWEFVFKWRFIFPIFCDFFRTILFLEKLLIHTFLEYFHTTSFWSSYFFRADAFFWGALFSEESIFLLLFQSRTSTNESLFENRKFFRAVTFQNSYLFGGGLV